MSETGEAKPASTAASEARLAGSKVAKPFFGLSEILPKMHYLLDCPRGQLRHAGAVLPQMCVARWRKGAICARAHMLRKAMCIRCHTRPARCHYCNNSYCNNSYCSNSYVLQ